MNDLEILQILTNTRWPPVTYIVYLTANSQQVRSQEMYVRTPQSTRKISEPTEYRQAYDTSEELSSRNGKLLGALVPLCAPLHYVSLGPQPGPRKGDKKPVYVLNITIPPIFVDNHVEPSKSAVNIQVRPFYASKSRGRLTQLVQNHTILHSFLSSIVEEFLIRNSFVKPPPQVQPRGGSTQNPRKRRRLADHTVSVYSPGPSQQPYIAAELDYFLPEQEPLQSCCSELCSGSCDGCSSCCDECLHVRKGKNPDPDPDLPEGAYYNEGQLDLGEYSPSDELLDTQVSLNLCLSSECLSGLGR